MAHLQFFDYKGYGETARKEIHYSQAVRVGDIIEISGQGGWDRLTSEIPSDLGSQMDRAFDNIEHTLQQAGGKGWSQVYSVHVYLNPLDLNEKGGHLVRNLRKYCPGHQPLLTVLGVKGLGLEPMLVEIEVKAHLGG